MTNKKLSRGQLVRMTLLTFLGIFIVVLRARKMMQLSMIDEVPSMTDWSILIGWSTVVLVLIWRIRQNSKQRFSDLEKGLVEK